MHAIAYSWGFVQEIFYLKSGMNYQGFFYFSFGPFSLSYYIIRRATFLTYMYEMVCLAFCFKFFIIVIGVQIT